MQQKGAWQEGAKQKIARYVEGSQIQAVIAQAISQGSNRCLLLCVGVAFFVLAFSWASSVMANNHGQFAEANRGAKCEHRCAFVEGGHRGCCAAHTLGARPSAGRGAEGFDLSVSPDEQEIVAVVQERITEHIATTPMPPTKTESRSKHGYGCATDHGGNRGSASGNAFRPDRIAEHMMEDNPVPQISKHIGEAVRSRPLERVRNRMEILVLSIKETLTAGASAADCGSYHGNSHGRISKQIKHQTVDSIEKGGRCASDATRTILAEAMEEGDAQEQACGGDHVDASRQAR